VTRHPTRADRGRLAHRGTRHDRGQATVELALSLPLLCVFVCGLVQVGVIVRNQVAVQLAAREAARAASAAAAPQEAGTAAALQATTLRPLVVQVTSASGMVTATVQYTDHTDVALIGALLPDATLTATVSMAAEPP